MHHRGRRAAAAAAQLPPLQRFLQLLVLAAVADCQQLIVSPSNTIQDVPLGTTLLVRCLAADNSATPQNLKWFGPKNYFDVTSGSSEANVIKSRLEMPRDPSTLDYSRLYTQPDSASSLSLNIENINLGDSGIYSCRGKVQGVDSMVNITVRPYASLDIRAASNQYLIQGNDFGVISCIVQGASPTIQWQINGQTLVSSGSSKYEQNANGLVVYNPTASDRGRYTCRGVLPVTGVAKEVIINVDVYVSPRITSPPVVLGPQGYGVVRQSVVLACNATGYPSPQYTWYIGTSTTAGSREVNDENFGTRFRPDRTSGMLTILEIRIEDDTWYWCKAQNQAGSQVAQVHLNVTMVAYFTWNQNSTDKNDGDTITLTCQSKAVPPANMQWLKWGRREPYSEGYQPDDKRIRVYQKFAAPTEELQAILPKEVWIEIRNATPQDMANYTCIATNIAGRNETTQEIRVNFRPVFVNVTSTVYNWEGNVRNLTCSTIAWPIPTWTWTYLGSVVGNDENHKIFYEYTNSSLQIRIPYLFTSLYPSYNFWGQYSCTASNNRGSALANVMLLEAQFPDAPYNLSVTDTTPTSVTLDAYLAPPRDIPIILVEVVAQLSRGSSAAISRRFELSEIHDMRIDRLYPNTAYTFRVTARNERGLGAREISREIRTLPLSRPYPVVIVSGTISSYPGSHLIIWDIFDDGGSPIIQYKINWRQKASATWNEQFVAAGTSSFVIPNLMPSTEYEAQILAVNIFGTSDPPTLRYNFRTIDGIVPTVVLQIGNPAVPAAIDLGPLEVDHVIIIAVTGMVAALLAIDVVCCFTRHCGLLMCIYKGAIEEKPRERLPVQTVSGLEDDAASTRAAEVQTRELDTDKSSSIPYHVGLSSKKPGDTLDTAAPSRASSSNPAAGRLSSRVEGNGNRQRWPARIEEDRSGLALPPLSRQPAAGSNPTSAPAATGKIFDNLAYNGVIRKPAYQGPSARNPVGAATAMQGPARPSGARSQLPEADAGTNRRPTAQIPRGAGLPDESPYQNLPVRRPAMAPPSSLRNEPISHRAQPDDRRAADQSRVSPRSTAQGSEAAVARTHPPVMLHGIENPGFHSPSSVSSRVSRLGPLPLLPNVTTFAGETDVDAFDDMPSREDIEVSRYFGNSRPTAPHVRVKMPSSSTDV